MTAAAPAMAEAAQIAVPLIETRNVTRILPGVVPTTLVHDVSLTIRKGEFVAITGVDRLAMRVFERGVGETASCGTGACAAVVAARLHAGVAPPAKEAASACCGGRRRGSCGLRGSHATNLPRDHTGGHGSRLAGSG